MKIEIEKNRNTENLYSIVARDLQDKILKFTHVYSMEKAKETKKEWLKALPN